MKCFSEYYFGHKFPFVVIFPYKFSSYFREQMSQDSNGIRNILEFHFIFFFLTFIIANEYLEIEIISFVGLCVSCPPILSWCS